MFGQSPHAYLFKKKIFYLNDERKQTWQLQIEFLIDLNYSWHGLMNDLELLKWFFSLWLQRDETAAASEVLEIQIVVQMSISRSLTRISMMTLILTSKKAVKLEWLAIFREDFIFLPLMTYELYSCSRQLLSGGSSLSLATLLTRDWHPFWRDNKTWRLTKSKNIIN